MRASNKSAKASHYFAVIIWLVSIAGAFFYLINRELSLFDPNEALAGFSSQSLVHNIALSLHEGEVIDKTLIHIRDESCHCNSYTTKHAIALDKRAQESHFLVKTLALSEIDKLPFIPSTPAVMLVGENNELIYFGPYAEGLACSKNNSMLELSWRNYEKGFNSHLIFNEALGCYCNRA